MINSQVENLQTLMNSFPGLMQLGNWNDFSTTCFAMHFYTSEPEYSVLLRPQNQSS